MHEIPDLDKKGLRDFGLMFGGFIVLLFGLAFPFFAGYTFPVWPWIVLGVMAAWSFAAPMTLKPFYQLWMRVGMTIGNVVNKVILAIVFFLVLLPIALVFRALGNDPMERKLDKTKTSYRIKSKTPSRENMEKPF